MDPFVRTLKDCLVKRLGEATAFLLPRQFGAISLSTPPNFRTAVTRQLNTSSTPPLP